MRSERKVPARTGEHDGERRGRASRMLDNVRRTDGSVRQPPGLDQLAPPERPSPWLEASVLGSSSAAEPVETRGHGPYSAPRTGTEKDFIQRQTSGVPRP